MAKIEANLISHFINYTDNFKLAEDLFRLGIKPQTVILNPNDKIYKIDLNTRTIEEPEWLAVKSDHESEIVFFEMDRYYDGMDLSTTACVVQYQVKNKETGESIVNAHLIPFYDVKTKAKEFKMIIPWDITHEVSQSAAEVSFSFRFFKISEDLKVSYNLSTLTAKSQILDTVAYEKKDLEGFISEEDIENFLPEEVGEGGEIPDLTDMAQTLFDELMTVYRYLYDHDTVYWEILD